jgi:hypothetical protein
VRVDHGCVERGYEQVEIGQHGCCCAVDNPVVPKDKALWLLGVALVLTGDRQRRVGEVQLAAPANKLGLVRSRCSNV